VCRKRAVGLDDLTERLIAQFGVRLIKLRPQGIFRRFEFQGRILKQKLPWIGGNGNFFNPPKFWWGLRP